MRLDGAPTRTRTADLLITNQLLYQLSYRGRLYHVNSYDNQCKSKLSKIIYYHNKKLKSLVTHAKFELNLDVLTLREVYGLEEQLKFVIFLGVGLSVLGLIGLLTCIQNGIKIKRFEHDENHDKEEIKNLLGRLYIRNMISLTSSSLGLILIVIGIILEG